LSQGAVGTDVAMACAPPKQANIRPTVSPETPFKPAPSGLIVCTGTQPRVELRSNPGLSKNVPSGHGLDACRSLAESRFSPGRSLGRSMIPGCPTIRFRLIQVQRSGHRGPPPRHPVLGSSRTGVFGWGRSGVGRSMLLGNPHGSLHAWPAGAPDSTDLSSVGEEDLRLTQRHRRASPPLPPNDFREAEPG
jgi:hypothetical protein